MHNIMSCIIVVVVFLPMIPSRGAFYSARWAPSARHLANPEAIRPMVALLGLTGPSYNAEKRNQ